MKLFVYWLDACDLKYATRENMPNLYKIVDVLKPITTKGRVPCISTKSASCLFFGRWDLEETYASFEEKTRTERIALEELPGKKAFIFFWLIQHRNKDGVFYSRPSKFFNCAGTTRATYLEKAFKNNKENEEFLENFLKKRGKEFDLVFVRDDVLEYCSFFEVGAPLLKRFKEKDLFLGRIFDLLPENRIVFSDHDTCRRPIALFGFHGSVKISYPSSFGEITNKIIEIDKKLG